jgi:hypothetical protein
MESVVELRKEAARKKQQAALARRLGPGLSVAGDRESMERHAMDMEAEAAALEAEADAVERSG